MTAEPNASEWMATQEEQQQLLDAVLNAQLDRDYAFGYMASALAWIAVGVPVPQETARRALDGLLTRAPKEARA